MGKSCKDCAAEGITTVRPIYVVKGKPVPGPRCCTHHRAFTKSRRQAAHGKRVELTYSISREDYAAIYRAQGNACAICQRATGATKNLAVDHDHACCDGPVSCGKCVRGLLCSVCNVYLGRMRDDPEAFMRGYEYLKRPPAQSVLLSLDSEG